MENKGFSCPVCGCSSLMMKYEASYVYSYALDSDAPGTKNMSEFLPFLYDNREQKDMKQYIECNKCGTQFPCYFHEWNPNMDASAIKTVLNQGSSDTGRC